MTASLASPGQVLREIYAGSGALFAADTARGRMEQDGASDTSNEFLARQTSTSHDKSNLRSMWLSLAFCGAAGGAVMIAAVALIAANHSIKESELTRERIQEINASIFDVPILKKEVEEVAAEQNRSRDVAQARTDATQSTAAEAKQFDAEMRQSITFVDQKVTQVAEAAEKREDAISLRVDKLEVDQMALAATRPPTRAADATANKASDPGTAAHAPPAFRLRRIEGGIATLVGPAGPVSVSVGETVAGLGKVLKIGRRGRNGFVVAGQGTLWAHWSKVASVSKVPAAPH